MDSQATAAATAVVCTTPNDLRSAQARVLFFRVMGDFLEERQTAPLEVLSSPDLMDAAIAHPSQDRALTAIAREQGLVIGTSPEERRATLRALIDANMARVRAAAARLPKITRDPQAFAAVVAKLAPPTAISSTTEDGTRPEPTDEEQDARLLLEAAVARMLADRGDWISKAETLLELAASMDEDAHVAIIDPFLGEFVANPPVMAELLGDPPSQVEFLTDLANLHTGTQALASGRSSTALRMFFLLQNNPLPGTRDGIGMAIHRILESPRWLVAMPEDESKPSARDIVDELLAIGDMAQNLKVGSHFIGGHKTAQLLDRRVLSLVTPERMETVLEEKQVVDRLRTLFQFQKASVAGRSQRVLGEQIVDTIENRDFAGQVIDSMPSDDARLACLGELAGLVDKAALGDATRARLTETLDNVQHNLIRTTHLFSDLRRDRLRSMKSYMRVLELAATGTFVPGRCQDEARSLLGRHARHPEFVRSYLAHLQSTGATGAQIGDLARRLQAAGVPFRDITQARVLVVEDEESAAAYVRMVLNDMGIDDVTLATDGRYAADMLDQQSKDFDLIICDWMMPRMSGLEVLQKVREVSPRVPFLMVTALATVETVRQAIANEVTAYIAKPFPPEQLEEKVLVLFNRGHDPDHVGLL